MTGLAVVTGERMVGTLARGLALAIVASGAEARRRGLAVIKRQYQ